MKRTIIFGVLASLLGLASTAQSSERLLGTDWVTGSMAYMSFPDNFAPLDDGLAISGTGNWNVMDNLDVQGGISYAWADGGGVDISFATLGVDGVYFFKPGAPINPFARGGLAVVRTSVDFGLGSIDDTNLGFSGGGGAEFALGEKIVVQTAGELFFIDGDEALSIDARLAYAFSPKLLGDFSLNYDFDSEITALSLGLAYRLAGRKKR